MIKQDADDEEVHDDKCLNMELIMDVGAGAERRRTTVTKHLWGLDGQAARTLPEKRLRFQCFFVGANHAGNAVARWSHTGILTFVQSAPITWHSK